MAIDLEERFKNYAKGHLDLIEKEYIYQVSKWKRYMGRMADAQKAALDDFHKIIEMSVKHEQERAQIAMLAFSIVGGAATAWIAPIVKQAVLKKVSNVVAFQDRFKQFNAASREVFGDVSETYTNTAIDLVKNAVGKRLEVRMPHGGLVNAIQGGSILSFSGAINEAFELEAGRVAKALGMISMTINRDIDYGKNLLKALRFRMRNDQRCLNEFSQEVVGKNILDEDFDALRRSFAENWFYYGNDPVPKSFWKIRKDIELEIWAAWIILQDFQTKKIEVSPNLPLQNEYTTPGQYETIGNDGIKLNDIIVRHLAYDLKQDTLAELSNSLEPSAGLFGIGKEYDSTFILGTLKVKSWANSHPGIKTSGIPDFKARNLGTLKNPDSIFM